jgi:hypothetical protein
MRERTLENAQVHLLATRYDLSRDSRLARAIACTLNKTLDAEEKRRGVSRVRTGELLLRTRNGPLVLPLRTPEALDRVIAGERWADVRRDILGECEARYLLAGSEAHTLRYRPPTSYEGFLAFHGRRMARVLTEAYSQDGLLAFTELQWIFLTSERRRHHAELPSGKTPGASSQCVI